MKNIFYLVIILFTYINCYSQKKSIKLYDVNKVIIQLNDFDDLSIVSSSSNFLLFQKNNYFTIASSQNKLKLYDFVIESKEIKALLTPNSKKIFFFLKKNDTESLFFGKLDIESGLYEEKEIQNTEFNPLNIKATFKFNEQNNELNIFSNNALWNLNLKNFVLDKKIDFDKKLKKNYLDFLFVNQNHICFKIESDIKPSYYTTKLRPNEWKLDSVMLFNKLSKKISRIKLHDGAIGAYPHTNNNIIVDYKNKISTLDTFNLQQNEYPKKENERVYKTLRRKENTFLFLGDKDLKTAKKHKYDKLYIKFQKQDKESSFDMFLYKNKENPDNLLRVDEINNLKQYTKSKTNLPINFYWNPCNNYFITDYSIVYERLNGIFSYYPKIEKIQKWNIDYTRENLKIHEGLTLNDQGNFTFYGYKGELNILNIFHENNFESNKTVQGLKETFFLLNQNVLSVYIKQQHVIVNLKNKKGDILWESEPIISKITEETNINTFINQEQTKAFIDISPSFYDENNKTYSYILDIEMGLISPYNHEHGFFISNDFSFLNSGIDKNSSMSIYKNNFEEENKIENTCFLTTLNNNDIIYKEEGDKNFILSGTVSKKGIEKKVKYRFPTSKQFNSRLAPFYYQNNKKLIFGVNENDLFVWNLNEEKPINNIKLNYNKAVYLTGSNKQLFIYYENGFIDVLDLETLNIVSTFTIHKKNENTYKAFFNNDLKFFIPKEIIREYHFVKDLKAFPLLSYELFLNRPDIILSNLGYTNSTIINIYKKAYLKRLKKSGYSESTDYLSIKKPKISLKNRDDISSISVDETLKLKLETSSDLDSLSIYINGVPIIKDKTNKNKFSKSIVLGYGLNKITIIGLNKEGIKSEPISLETTYNTFKKPKIYYIGIGVSKYLDNSMNLKFADKDVRSISKALSNTFKSRIQIDTLTNENSTKENILKLKNTLDNTTINDIVIISFSGHGLVDDKNDFFFATNNIDFKDPKVNGLSYQDIQGLVKNIPARKRLLLIDACHSGELDKEDITVTQNTNKNITSHIPEGAKGAIGKSNKKSIKNSFEVMKSLFYDTDRGNGTFVISAAGGKEFAFESKDWGNGVFTYSFLKAIEELTIDKYGNKQPVTISMIKNYIYKKVTLLTNNQQKPTSRSDNIEWDWFLID